MIKIRKYAESDAHSLWKIYFHTVRNINIRDYSLAQVIAWAPEDIDPGVWQQKMKSISPCVAEIDGEIVGYSDIQDNGLIDHFFCHHEHQGKGVGRALMEHVLDVGRSKGLVRFYSEVSITARPFYERFGFKVVKEQVVKIRGEALTNFVMEKFI
ncbi:GNAT family N-acetyltransferase [Vibrio mytili]|uniref:GNAT family N-acetyltransferase n=1 Tax=Vibrio mytili TaxID=50718 RepID=UPI002F4163FC